MGPTRYKLGIAGNLSISNSCLTALENNSFLQGCETKSEWKEFYVQTRLRPEFVPSRLGHMLVTWFQLTSSLVVSILAMSQVCMAASPDTEMRESPLIPNSITVHTLSRRRPVHLSNSPQSRITEWLLLRTYLPTVFWKLHVVLCISKMGA